MGKSGKVRAHLICIGVPGGQLMVYFLLIVMIVLLFSTTLYFRHASRRLAQLETDIQDERANRRYHEIFENASDAVFVVEVGRDKTFRFESLNPAAEQAFDPDRMGLAGVPFDEVARRINTPRMQLVLLHLDEHLRKAVQSGMQVHYEAELYCSGGAEDCLFAISLVPMADDGGITHVLCFARDMTARALYERELLERSRLEERFSGFAASAPGFFFTYRHGADGSNAMPFASAGIRDLFGLQPEDVAGDISKLNLCIHPEDLKLFFDAMAQSAARLAPLHVEFRVQHPSKGRIWLEARALPQSGADGGVLWHGFMHDIGERKRVEAALMQSHARLEEAQRIGQMGSWDLDHVTGTLSWSDEIFRIFEIDRNQFGASYAAFLEAIHPEDRAAVDQAYRHSLETRTPYSIEHRLLLPGGNIKHVRERCETTFDAEGKPLASSGTVQDITATKIVEQKLQEMQQRLREAVLIRENKREETSKRIAWEMNEELAQLMAAQKMHLYGMRMQFPRENSALRELSLEMGELIDKSLKVIRELVSELRPTALQLGIAPALEWLVMEYNKQPEISCQLQVSETGMPLDDQVALLVFRAAEEVLDHAAKVVGMSRVLMSWKSDGRNCVLGIRYDGHILPGDFFSQIPPSLMVMQERIRAHGGEMRIFSELEHHSVIEVSFRPAEAD